MIVFFPANYVLIPNSICILPERAYASKGVFHVRKKEYFQWIRIVYRDEHLFWSNHHVCRLFCSFFCGFSDTSPNGLKCIQCIGSTKNQFMIKTKPNRVRPQNRLFWNSKHGPILSSKRNDARAWCAIMTLPGATWQNNKSTPFLSVWLLYLDLCRLQNQR